MIAAVGIQLKATTVLNSSGNTVAVYFRAMGCPKRVAGYPHVCRVYNQVAPGESVSYAWKPHQTRRVAQVVERDQAFQSQGQPEKMYTWQGFTFVPKRLWDFKRAKHVEKMVVQSKNDSFKFIPKVGFLPF